MTDVTFRCQAVTGQFERVVRRVGGFVVQPTPRAVRSLAWRPWTERAPPAAPPSGFLDKKHDLPTLEPALTSTATGFAAVLREATRADHTAAEQSPFATELMAGRLPRAAYVDLLLQSHPVYEALERAATAHAGTPEVQPFLHPGLIRLPSLEADLAFLAGPRWRDRLDPTPATARYAARVTEVGASWPAGVVAHSYLRYLGDLSGGQIIRRIVRDTYGLGLDGTRFYVFDAIPRPKPFKDAYRAALDAAPWDAAEQARVVEEVALAFRLNRDLFADLGDRHLPR